VPHTVKTVLAQTAQLVQPAMALSSHAKPATDAQIADATGPHRPVTVPVSHVIPQTTAQHAIHALSVMVSVARLVTATLARSATANAVHSATATAVRAQLLVTANVVNGLLVTRSATTVAHAMVLAPKSAQDAVHSATVRVLQLAATTAHAMLRVTASAATA
jgi:hypothetical protein